MPTKVTGGNQRTLFCSQHRLTTLTMDLVLTTVRELGIAKFRYRILVVALVVAIRRISGRILTLRSTTCSRLQRRIAPVGSFGTVGSVDLVFADPAQKYTVA